VGFVQVYQQCPSRPHETYLFLNYLGKENLLFLHGKAAKEMRLRCGSVAAPLTACSDSHHPPRGRLPSKSKSKRL
jgi:hypothetical protein